MNNPQVSEEIQQASSSSVETEPIPNDGEQKSTDKVDSMENILLEIGEEEALEAARKGKSPYTVRKITALGMMDVALLTANANQLRFLITYNRESSTYYVSFVLIVLSLILQVGVGIALIFKRRMKSTGNDEYLPKTNDTLTVGVFLITIINVFVASFTVTTTPNHTAS